MIGDVDGVSGLSAGESSLSFMFRSLIVFLTSVIGPVRLSISSQKSIKRALGGP